MSQLQKVVSKIRTKPHNDPLRTQNRPMFAGKKVTKARTIRSTDQRAQLWINQNLKCMHFVHVTSSQKLSPTSQTLYALRLPFVCH